MAYDGWIEFGGTELVNLSRTAQLAEVLGIDTLWTDPDSVQWIEDALGGENYDSLVETPWYDENNPASMEFAGVVPLSIAGLDDSTLESSTTEYITDGGSSGKARNRTLILVANVTLIASTSRGADFGKRWLDRVLRGSSARTNCSGSELRYFQYRQGVDEPAPPQAHRRDVSLSRGTSVTRKRTSECSATWMVTYTWTANDPFEYGDPVLQFTNLGGSNVSGRGMINRVANSSFEIDTSGWYTNPASGTFNRVGSSQVDGGYVGSFVSTSTAANQFVVYDLVPVAPRETCTFSGFLKMQGIASAYYLQVIWYQGSSFLSATSERYEAADLSGTVFTRLSVTATAPPGADGVTIQFAPVDPLPVGAGFQIDAAMIEGGSVLTTYVVGSGTRNLVEATCPVYDYSPIYDPLHPALVPAPEAPDFYPAGWDLLPGVSIRRSWVRLGPVEPSALRTVPLLTLTAPSEHRMVRVSIWPVDAPDDSRCEPLWSAVVSYLPPGVDFVIDGEQQACYVWDGVSPSVRRSDSLTYGTGARPLEWAALTESDGLLVVLDYINDGAHGDSSVRAELSLVPKSD